MHSRITSIKSPSLCMTNFRQVSQQLRSSYISRIVAAAKQADEYWILRCSCCRNTLCLRAHGFVHSPSLRHHTGSLTLPAPEAGDFEELLLLYMASTSGKLIPFSNPHLFGILIYLFNQVWLSIYVNSHICDTRSLQRTRSLNQGTEIFQKYRSHSGHQR